jgi:hypothetical protein
MPRVYVNIDNSDIIDELSDDELDALILEARKRNQRKGPGSLHGASLSELPGAFSEHEMADLAYAVEHSDAYGCLRILQSCLAVNLHVLSPASAQPAVTQ